MREFKIFSAYTAVITAMFLVFLYIIIAVPASAATITEVSGPLGKARFLNTGDFRSLGERGTGQSVEGHDLLGTGGYAGIFKEATSPLPSFGRHTATGTGIFYDSQDRVLTWYEPKFYTPVKSLSFLLTDANDQKNSFFVAAAEGSALSIAHAPNASDHWLNFLFDTPTKNPSIGFFTRHNDGFGVSDVHVAPVPITSTAALLLSAIVAIGAVATLKPKAPTYG